LPPKVHFHSAGREKLSLLIKQDIAETHAEMLNEKSRRQCAENFLPPANFATRPIKTNALTLIMSIFILVGTFILTGTG